MKTGNAGIAAGALAVAGLAGFFFWSKARGAENQAQAEVKTRALPALPSKSKGQNRVWKFVLLAISPKEECLKVFWVSSVLVAFPECRR